MNWRRSSPGISLLLPTQNAERTVELCIRSFVSFADEIIVVDNGSTDSSRDVVRQLVREYDHLQFFDVPQLKDLYENRQYAFERSRFSWVARLDSDYVAHTDGSYDIRRLRDIVLSTPRGIRPVAYCTKQVNLTWDLFTTGEIHAAPDDWTMPPVSSLNARIVQRYPGMKFVRLGRWEAVRWQNWLKRVPLADPYWFHLNWKTKRDYLFRRERTNWREQGDFEKYPTLTSYLHAVLPTKYGTESLDDAAEKLFRESLEPYFRRYDASQYYPYPLLLRQALRESSPAGSGGINRS